jgi:hypothetical protein
VAHKHASHFFASLRKDHVGKSGEFLFKIQKYLDGAKSAIHHYGPVRIFPESVNAAGETRGSSVGADECKEEEPLVQWAIVRALSSAFMLFKCVLCVDISMLFVRAL